MRTCSVFRTIASTSALLIFVIRPATLRADGTAFNGIAILDNSAGPNTANINVPTVQLPGGLSTPPFQFISGLTGNFSYMVIPDPTGGTNNIMKFTDININGTGFMVPDPLSPGSMIDTGDLMLSLDMTVPQIGMWNASTNMIDATFPVMISFGNPDFDTLLGTLGLLPLTASGQLTGDFTPAALGKGPIGMGTMKLMGTVDPLPFGVSADLILSADATNTAVPEPATLLLFGSGFAALAARRRRQ